MPFQIYQPLLPCFCPQERPGSSCAALVPGSADSADGEAELKWYQFDDSVISEWDPDHLEMDCFGGRPIEDWNNRLSSRNAHANIERANSAYMLFYDRVPVAAEQPGASSEMLATPCKEVQASRRAAPATAANAPVSTAGSTELPAAAEAAASTAAITAAGAPSTPPFGMSGRLFNDLVRENLQWAYVSHLMDRQYYTFVRQLVETTLERPLSARKVRRTAAGTSNSSPGAGRLTPEGSAALPADIIAEMPAAVGTATATQSSGAGDPLASPSRSASLSTEMGEAGVSRRDAETRLINFRLATSFLLHVLVHENSKWAREEVAAWSEQLAQMMRPADDATLRMWLHHLQVRLVVGRWVANSPCFSAKGPHNSCCTRTVFESQANITLSSASLYA